MFTEIKATYRVVTPLFCSGADQRYAELRLPSFKGVLRFWWRALAWSRLRGNLGVIGHEEDRLFGSSSHGQSPVSLVRVEYRQRKSEAGNDLRKRVGAGGRYLGYGLMDAGTDQRGFLRPGFDFTVTMRVREPKQEVEHLIGALKTLGILGGIGARSRKGFGSVSLESLCLGGEETWRPPASAESLSNAIQEILKSSGRGGLAEYTALSSQSRIVLMQSDHSDPLKLLDIIGRELRDGIRTAPRRERIAFGLPREPRVERRASPLFVHIHQCSGSPIGVLAFLPARFLDDQNHTHQGDLYRPVDAFFNRLCGRRQRGLQFTVNEAKA